MFSRTVPISSNGLPTIGPTVIPTPSAIATVSPGPTVQVTPTPVPMCIVPNLVGLKSNKAVAPWTAAGFAANNLTFSPLVPPTYTIATQSIWPAGGSVLCTSSMTVKP